MSIWRRDSNGCVVLSEALVCKNKIILLTALALHSARAGILQALAMTCPRENMEATS